MKNFKRNLAEIQKLDNNTNVMKAKPTTYEERVQAAREAFYDSNQKAEDARKINPINWNEVVKKSKEK